MAVRYRRGVVGENQRSCHLVRVPQDPGVPAVLTALCGQRLAVDQAEQLEMFHGMPCIVCLTLGTAPSTEQLPR